MNRSGEAAHQYPPCDSCGLPVELCTALAFIEIMCVAVLRGEIWNAQYCAQRALEMLDT